MKRTVFTCAIAICLGIASHAVAQNLLVNGSFEAYSPAWNDNNGLAGFPDVQANYMANLTGWSDASVLGSWSSSYGADPFISGGPVGYIASSGSYGIGLYFNGAGSLQEGIQQTVSVTPGVPLSFSIDLANGFLYNGSYFAQSSNGTLSLEIMQGGSVLDSADFSSGTGAAGAYTTDSYAFTPTASSIGVIIRYTGGGSGQEIWIDNASLKVVPESSTTALLVIGGAAVVILRKLKGSKGNLLL